MSVGSLYEYFADKKALGKAVLDRCAARKLQRMLEEVPKLHERTAARAIEGLVGVYIDLIVEQCNLTKLLLEQAIYVSLDEEPASIREGFAGIVRSFLTLRSTELRDLNVDIATFLVVNTLDSVFRSVIRTQPEYLNSPDFRFELTALIGRFVLL